jgi:nucleotide-binding universal stress UspA family protein/hemerythrin-like domain-containing protein
MYRHLLVPVDGTDLSVELVGNAVAMARSLDARITFFHAVPDHAGSLRGEAELVRVTSQDDYAYAFTGKAREVLAKAEAAAHAFGVPCESAHAVSDRPAAAIVEAARAHGCDLIFMASHGRGGKLGMAVASETLSVLMNAGLPVLVSSTGDLQAPARAIGIIRDEHRSIAAVLHGWIHALATACAGSGAADPPLMAATVRYLRVFPATLHHPKEDQHLFKRLRERTHSVDLELDELERQHALDHLLVDDLAREVQVLAEARTAQAAMAATRTLYERVQAYAAFLWEHMGREEGVILPAAQRHLSEADWSEIEAAFADNGDPRFGGENDREFRQLFSRIVNLANKSPRTVHFGLGDGG